MPSLPKQPLLLETRLFATFVATLASFALPAAAQELGRERWRVDLGAPLVAQPAIGADGRIAVLTEKALVVLGADGAFVSAYTDALAPSQPLWSGDALWYRTADGWKVAGTEPTCAADVQSGLALPGGEALFAPKAELVRCGSERVAAGRRRGAEGRLLPVGDGFVSVDLWFVEFLGPDFRVRGTRTLGEWGTPVGSGRAGLYVATQGARIDLVDPRGAAIWKGVPAIGGVPVETQAGGLLLLGDRGVTMATPPFESWSLPVAAGVRAATVLEGGAVAVLERTGRIGVVQEGRLVWGRALKEAGPVLTAHPGGLLLASEGTSLVAFEAPPPEHAGPLARCESVPPPAFDGRTLTVSGPALRTGETCQATVLATTCAKAGCADAGKVTWSQPCGADCDAAMAGDVLVVLDGKAIRRVDAKGRVRAEKAGLSKSEHAPRLAVASDGGLVVRRGRELTFRPKRGQPVTKALSLEWIAGPIVSRGEAIGVDDKLRLVSMGRGSERETVLPTQRRPGAPAPIVRMDSFGDTVCMEGRDRAGCAAGGQVLPAMSLVPRTMLFGQQLRTCGGERALCLFSPAAAAPEVPFWSADGRIDALQPLGDGTVAALVEGRRVVALWPDGKERWSVEVGTEACDRGWMALAGDRLDVRGCGRVVQIALR